MKATEISDGGRFAHGSADRSRVRVHLSPTTSPTSTKGSKRMTKLSELIAGLRCDGDEWRIVVGNDWLQGRTVYGGLAAALCHEACQLAEKDLPPLRSAQFTFVGPAAGELRLRPVMLRRGKSAIFFRVELAGELGLATPTLHSASRQTDLRSFPTPELRFLLRSPRRNVPICSKARRER